MNYKLTYEKLIKKCFSRLVVVAFVSSIFAATLSGPVIHAGLETRDAGKISGELVISDKNGVQQPSPTATEIYSSTRTRTLSPNKKDGVRFVTTKPTLTVPAVALRKTDRRSVVEFPGRGFNTIQDAINAVPDGGILKLAAGLYTVNDGLFVRDKTVFFEGPGRRHGSTATLVAPRPDRVVPADSAVGVINFINGGGGVEGFETFGGDASVVITGRSDRSLTIKDMTLADNGRAILHLAPSHLNVTDCLIFHCKWNGISFAPKNLDLVSFVPQLVVTDTELIDGDNIGIYVNHGHFEVIDTSLGGWPGGGIAVVNSSALILDNHLIKNGKFGILLWQSQGVVLDARIEDTTSVNGFLGDGISVWCSGAMLSGLEIDNSDRAGLSNFDSHIDFGDCELTCNAIDIDVEIGGLCVGVPPTFDDKGGILCGCPNATGPCIAQSSGPPSLPFLVTGLE